ncbi:GAF and ANTAR domain-containing protein [Kribbella sp. NPDC051770]|uniref:GAF and ANTAR domain-containing protein n=1 Tax=Kribbella sp. NPDC051770 TaxID=3155413 RepID=UPI0034150E02
MLPTTSPTTQLVGLLHELSGENQVATAAVQAVSRLVGWDGVSLMFVRRRRLTPLAASDPRMTFADELQVEYHEGPAYDALSGTQPVSCQDLAGSERWTTWAPPAQQLGWRSWVSIRLAGRGGSNLGVLSVADPRPAILDAELLGVLQPLAVHLSVALDVARIADTLTTAAETRERIGQAVGILMERYGVDAAQAFAVLNRYSQNSNRKLHDVAEELMRTRRLPQTRGSS